MTQEQLRMQVLAGIITEGQYKEKMEEEDSMGKVGNSYPAPKLSKKEGLINRFRKVFNDISQNKIFVGKDPEIEGMNAVFYNDNDSFYDLDEGDKVSCLARIPSMLDTPRPISKYPDVTPFNSDDLSIIYRILASSVYGIKMGCPDIMNDEDGKYILIKTPEGQGYITRKGEGQGLRQGPKHDLGMGFEFTLL